jgi:hypothetical protein
MADKKELTEAGLPEREEGALDRECVESVETESGAENWTMMYYSIRGRSSWEIFSYCKGNRWLIRSN